MCLIVLGLGVDPKTPFVLAANRDEFFERPSAPAAFWPDAPQVFGGRDLLSGGTWLGVTRQGRFAALTNVRDPRRNRKDARSRGELVSGFLSGGSSPRDYLVDVSHRADAYNPFNLLVGELGAPPLIWFLGTESPGIRELPAGIHGVSNGDLDEPWPKVVRARAAVETHRGDPERLLGLLRDRTRAPDAELPDTGVGLELERLLSSIFIESPRYGTRASTVVTLSADGRLAVTEVTHEAGSPSVSRVDAELRLG